MRGSADIGSTANREAVKQDLKYPSGKDAVDVRLEGVSKRFGEVWALRSTDLSINRGEFFSLLGSSGSGKTTTLRIVAGFEEPTTGAVYLQERDVTRTAPYERNVNTVFQDYALFPHMNVEENVGYGLRVRRVKKGDITQRVREVLTLVRLAGFEQRRPSQLSGGQRQRVALARALVNVPAVLLLDEPLGALDLKLRREMQVELKRIQRDVGITFVYVTHDQEEAMSMSDRIAVMSEGQIVQVGAPADVYERPANAFVAGFVGVSNLLSGRAVHRDGALVQIDVEGAERIVIPAEQGVEPGQSVVLTVRPERIEMHRPGAEVSPRLNSIRGRVTDVSYTGPFTRYGVVACNLEIAVVEPNLGDERSWRLGEEVWLNWPADQSYVLQGSDEELRRGREAVAVDSTG